MFHWTCHISPHLGRPVFLTIDHDCSLLWLVWQQFQSFIKMTLLDNKILQPLLLLLLLPLLILMSSLLFLLLIIIIMVSFLWLLWQVSQFLKVLEIVKVSIERKRRKVYKKAPLCIGCLNSTSGSFSKRKILFHYFKKRSTKVKILMRYKLQSSASSWW